MEDKTPKKRSGSLDVWRMHCEEITSRSPQEKIPQELENDIRSLQRESEFLVRNLEKANDDLFDEVDGRLTGFALFGQEFGQILSKSSQVLQEFEQIQKNPRQYRDLLNKLDKQLHPFHADLDDIEDQLNSLRACDSLNMKTEKYLIDRLNYVKGQVRYKSMYPENKVYIQLKKIRRWKKSVESWMSKIRDVIDKYYSDSREAGDASPDEWRSKYRDNPLREQVALGRVQTTLLRFQIESVQKEVQKLSFLSKSREGVNQLIVDLWKYYEEATKTVESVEQLGAECKQYFKELELYQAQAYSLINGLKRSLPKDYHFYYPSETYLLEGEPIDVTLPGSCTVYATRWILREWGVDIKKMANEVQVANDIGYTFNVGILKNRIITGFEKYGLKARTGNFNTFEDIERLLSGGNFILATLYREEVGGHSIVICKAFRENNGGRYLMVVDLHFRNQGVCKVYYETMRGFLLNDCIVVGDNV